MGQRGGTRRVVIAREGSRQPRRYTSTLLKVGEGASGLSSGGQEGGDLSRGIGGT